MWFSNQFHDTSFNVEEELSVEFDDSYIVDKETKLETMRADAVTFSDVKILLVWYLMERYNLSEEEARKHIAEGSGSEDNNDDLND